MNNTQIKNGNTGRARSLPGRSLLGGVYFFVSVCLLVIAAGKTEAQTVSHPVSEITQTAKFFFYTQLLSPTEKRDIKYIVVRASNGDIKTVFNACDVCYQAEKGYSQSGGILRCNNCGTKFGIDTLGGQNTAGTCHPGYLPHSIVGDQVVINVSDLLLGAYYFRPQAVTGIDEVAKVRDDISIRQSRSEVTVTLPRVAERTFHIYAINGQHRASFTDASRVVTFSLSGMVPGAYVLGIESATGLTSKMFLVY